MDIENLLSAFKIDARCVSQKAVRNANLYDFELAPGTKVNQFNRYLDEFALALRAKSKPMLRTIPSIGVVRLEVIVNDPEKIDFFDHSHDKIIGGLPMYIGSSIDGEDVSIDLSKHPHTLIAGCTGSGKSTLLHTIIANAIGNDNTQTFIIDTKNIEFKDYDHKFDNIYVGSSYKDGLDLLKFVYDQMEFRYDMIKRNSIEGHNNIIVIIDEFADIMMQDDGNVFHKLFCKLTQKCRAANIYCILATQRPSVDIVSGLIKANFPARIACKVASGTDARVILDTNGAEHLVGNGDAIINTVEHSYKRFQVAYTNSNEVIEQFKSKKSWYDHA